MCNYEKIYSLAKERPHLKQVLSLYEKVCKFKNEVKGISEVGKILDVFAKIFEVPYEFVSFLRKGIENLETSPLKNPESLDALPLSSESTEEVKRLLFILKKGFYLASKKTGPLPFKDGRCPVCGSPSSLSVIDESNKRYLICTLCETKGETFRIGCNYCLTKDPLKVEMLVDEDEVRVELCKNCKHYIKSFKSDVLVKFEDPFLVDLISLPLDVIAQEKGFMRSSPNVLGILKVN